MLLHLYFDTFTLSNLFSFSSVLPSSVSSSLTTILLNIQVNQTEKYSLTSSTPLQSTSGVATTNSLVINFSQIIYVPVQDPELSLIDLDIEALGYFRQHQTTDLETSPEQRDLGSCSCIVSFHEHGLTKTLTLRSNDHHNSSASSSSSNIIGTLTLSIFYYHFPMNISNFQPKPTLSSSLTSIERQQRFNREYSFLRSRSANWKGDRIATWNYTTQSLLDQDESILFSKELVGLSSESGKQRKGQRESSAQRSQRERQERQRSSKSRSTSPPKARKTVMSVGFTGDGVSWPQDQQDLPLFSSSHDPHGSHGLRSSCGEKLQSKLWLAEERRLHLLNKSMELTRQKNLKMNQRHDQILRERKRQSVTEQQLRELLELKEKSIERLEKRYRELKYHQSGSAPGSAPTQQRQLQQHRGGAGAQESRRRQLQQQQEMDPYGYGHIKLFKQRKEEKERKLQQKILREKQRNSYIGTSPSRPRPRSASKTSGAERGDRKEGRREEGQRSRSIEKSKSVKSKRSKSLAMPLSSKERTRDRDRDRGRDGEREIGKAATRYVSRAKRLDPESPLLEDREREREREREKANRDSIWKMMLLGESSEEHESESDEDEEEEREKQGKRERVAELRLNRPRETSSPFLFTKESKKTKKEREKKQRNEMTRGELSHSSSSPSSSFASSGASSSRPSPSSSSQQMRHTTAPTTAVDVLLARHHHESVPPFYLH
jgi:hypothetical protein